MAKKKPCPVCAAPDREAIDGVLRAEGVRPAKRRWPDYPLTRLWQHRRQCLGLEANETGIAPQSAAEGAPAASLSSPDTLAAPETAVVTPPAPPASLPQDSPEQPGGEPTLAAARSAPLAPPPPPRHPASVTAEQRAAYIVGLILSREWSPATVGELAATWGVDRRTVRQYAHAAGMLLRLDRGSLEVVRSQAIAETEHIRDTALSGEEPDLKAAMAAQKHLDTIRGLLVQSPLVQVNVNAREEADRMQDMLWSRVEEKLRHIPGALEAALEAVREVEAERRRAVGIIDVPGEVTT